MGVREFFVNIWKVLKPIGRFLNDIFVFALVLVVYFIGVGMSRILYKGKKQKPQTTYWVNPDEKKTTASDYYRMF